VEPRQQNLRELTTVGLAQIAAVADVLVEPHDRHVQLADVLVALEAAFISDIAWTALDEEHWRVNLIVEIVVHTSHAAARDTPGGNARIADGTDGHEPAARKAVRGYPAR